MSLRLKVFKSEASFSWVDRHKATGKSSKMTSFRVTRDRHHLFKEMCEAYCVRDTILYFFFSSASTSCHQIMQVVRRRRSTSGYNVTTLYYRIIFNTLTLNNTCCPVFLPLTYYNLKGICLTSTFSSYRNLQYNLNNE